MDDTTGGVYIQYPNFASADDFVYVFWSQYESSPTLKIIALRRSVDAGTTWLPRTTVARDPSGRWYSNEFAAATEKMVGLVALRLQAADQFGFSSEAGISWIFYDAQTQSFDRFIIQSNGIHLVREYWYLSNREVGYFYSSDFGFSWSVPVVLSTADGIRSDQPYIAGDNKGNIFVIWRDGKYGGTWDGTILFRRSTNFGETWENEIRMTAQPSGNFPRVCVDKAFVTAAWDDTVGGCVIRISSDYGATFSPRQLIGSLGGNVTIGLSFPWVHTAWRAWAGGNPEIHYRRGRIITTSINEEPSLPRQFTLFQNYPNPFNSQTTICFEIPEPSFLKLKIYNILGQEVETILSEMKEAGVHKIKYDGTKLKSGVYSYRLSVVPLARRDLVSTDGRNRQTQKLNVSRKFILIK